MGIQRPGSAAGTASAEALEASVEQAKAADAASSYGGAEHTDAGTRLAGDAVANGVDPVHARRGGGWGGARDLAEDGVRTPGCRDRLAFYARGGAGCGVVDPLSADAEGREAAEADAGAAVAAADCGRGRAVAVDGEAVGPRSGVEVGDQQDRRCHRPLQG